jgi:hypothetical protein
MRSKLLLTLFAFAANTFGQMTPTPETITIPNPTLLIEKLLGMPKTRVGATSTTTVTVMITGLVTLHDKLSGATPVPKDLLLMDATMPGGMLMPHKPIVMANNLYSPSPGPGQTLKTIGNASYVILRSLEHLTFAPASSDPLKYSDAPPAAICPTTAESESLYFLPRLSHVARKADGSRPAETDLDPHHINPNSGDPIIGIMPITYGTLKANVGNKAVWAFKDDPMSSSATHVQLIADAVFWTFTIPGDTITLMSNGQSVLTLKASVLDRIQLIIANAPDPDGIAFLAGSPVGAYVRKQPVDEHFTLYYSFLTDTTIPHYTRYKPVAIGACEADVFRTDQCALSDYLIVPRPSFCPPPPPLVGGLNCGPDNLP